MKQVYVVPLGNTYSLGPIEWAESARHYIEETDSAEYGKLVYDGEESFWYDGEQWIPAERGEQ